MNYLGLLCLAGHPPIMSAQLSWSVHSLSHSHLSSISSFLITFLFRIVFYISTHKSAQNSHCEKVVQLRSTTGSAWNTDIGLTSCRRWIQNLQLSVAVAVRIRNKYCREIQKTTKFFNKIDHRKTILLQMINCHTLLSITK